jgi:hypothetical protein
MVTLIFAVAALIVALAVARYLLGAEGFAKAVQCLYSEVKKLSWLAYLEAKRVVASVERHGWKHYMPAALLLFIGVIVWRLAHGQPSPNVQEIGTIIVPLVTGSAAVAFSPANNTQGVPAEGRTGPGNAA